METGPETSDSAKSIQTVSSGIKVWILTLARVLPGHPASPERGRHTDSTSDQASPREAPRLESGPSSHIPSPGLLSLQSPQGGPSLPWRPLKPIPDWTVWVHRSGGDWKELLWRGAAVAAVGHGERLLRATSL